jgi:ABC-2 type transport system permease protein
MSPKRVLALARRVMVQVIRDRRTVGLLVIGPMLILTLGAELFRSEPPPVGIGVVNSDDGVSTPVTGRIELGRSIANELAASDAFAVTDLNEEEAEQLLNEGAVLGVLVLPPDFSASYARSREIVLDLRLEGSNPARSSAIAAYCAQAAVNALAELAAISFQVPGPSQPDGGEMPFPVSVEASYVYAGEEFDAMDFVAPVYIGVLALFFVFLLACVSFLRERSQGTMERLLATPATRVDVVLGYMLGLGLFAVLQVTVILLFTVWVLKIHYLGSLALLLLIVALLAVVGVSLGILASAFARTEFQVLQFIPLLIIPQILLGGTLWSVPELPRYLQPLAYLMPVYYANQALRDVMLRGWGLAEIWPNLLVLVGMAGFLMGAGALITRREVG